MIRNIFVASLLSVTATAAAAELTYGTAFAKFHDFDVDGAGTIDVKSFGGGIEYRYDNSADNPDNPSSPPRRPRRQGAVHGGGRVLLSGGRLGRGRRQVHRRQLLCRRRGGASGVHVRTRELLRRGLERGRRQVLQGWLCV